MEHKIIKEFLSASECEKFFQVLDIVLQCQQVERELNIQKEPQPSAKPQINHFKRHMFLLVHARVCQVNFNKKCNLRHCSSIRQVLTHALECEMDETCPVKYCRTGRRLAFHFDNCPSSTCPVCEFASEANGLNRRNSTSPRHFFYNHSNVEKKHDTCGSINCHEFVCDPFRTSNPPNKLGQQSSSIDATNSITQRNHSIIHKNYGNQH